MNYFASKMNTQQIPINHQVHPKCITMKKNFAILIILLTINTLNAQNISKYSERLIDNWEFIRQDLGSIWEAVRPVKPGSPQSVPLWEKISLPHCFNATDAVNPYVNYYQGPGWYRTMLKVQNPYKNGRTLLHFEGAGQKTQVYIDTIKVGQHVGGYDEWYVDITEAIAKFGNPVKVPLSIRCDNSRDTEMIPSDLSDFNIYGGLYRYLNIVYVPNIYIEQVHITPKITENEDGEVELQINFSNIPNSKLEITIRSPQHNNIILKKIVPALHKTLSIKLKMNSIEKWSPESPALYAITIKNITDEGEQEYTDRFGFRSYYFKEHGPFYLNKKRYLIRGTHRHEDHAGVGAAMTEEMIRKEMYLMKEMGANFVRLGHYQQSRIVLNLCDSLGIMVWEEIPWCRGGLGGTTYKQQARRLLTNMINQHYNHPSIIIWGLGNENDWPGDFPKFDTLQIASFMKELHELSHQLDSTRLTGIRRCDFCKNIVDIYSPSIWAGWYRGKFTEYRQSTLDYIQQVNHFLHMEWGGSSHAGRHDENPDKDLENVQEGMGTDERDGDAAPVGGQARVSRDGNWSETYICNLFDWHLHEQLSMPYLSGTAQWVFKDFSTPVRPNNPIPYVNEKGVLQRDFTKKESYYVFQSYWSAKPMIHIYGHNWPVRWGEKNQARMVKVYSNCQEVELFLNGKSMGKKKRNTQIYPACGLFWNVVFQPGHNTLRAIGNSNDTTLTDEISLQYQTEKWDKPDHFILSEEPIDNNHSWLHVKLVDKNGILCLDAKQFVEFSICGDAELIKDEGTVHGSQKVQLCNGQAKIMIKKFGKLFAVSVKSKETRTSLLYPTSIGQ